MINGLTVAEYLSRLNVSAWFVNPRGHLYVLLSRGRPSVNEVDFETAKKLVMAMWSREDTIRYGMPFISGTPKDPRLEGRIVMLSAAAASSAARLVQEIVGSQGRKCLSDEARGHAKRIRDEVRLVQRMSASSKKGAKEATARSEIREMVLRCKQKYGLSRDRMLEILQQEVELAKVEDVMSS